MKRAIAIVVLLSLVGALLAFTLSRRTTVHRIQIPGHPAETVDFILCTAMNGEYGYIVRFGRAETKEPLVSSEVSVVELKAGTRVEYQDETLTVYGPQNQRITVPGFIP